VLANRIWQHLIGRGIVSTVDNFGRTGQPPTHPELLDHLADRLLASHWSIKALVREIVLSRTFAMSSQFSAAGQAVDPDNHLLWRAHRRRVDAESLRDSMLAVAGLLDTAPMQSSVWYLGDQATSVGDNKVRRRTDFHCRSVYLPIIRNDLPELFEVFDFANPHAATGMRPQTTVATQGLFLLNDPMVMEAAEAVARALLAHEKTCDNATRVDLMCQRILGVCLDKEECRQLLDFVLNMEQQLQAQGNAEPTVGAWSLTCHALFAHSRFQFLE
jgi:hypothetical protein